MMKKIKEDVPVNKEFDKDYKNKNHNLKLNKETNHFIFYYSETDKDCINKVSDILENSYKRITTNFKKQLEEKLTIELFSNIEELHVTLGFPNAPDWIRGGIGIDRIVIASPLNPPPGSTFENVINTAVHEFVHIIINKVNNNTPRWLNEGIACFEAKDNDEKWIRKTVKDGLLDNTIPTFKDLDTGEDFEKFFKCNGYQYSYTIVESIIKVYGYDKLYRLLKTPNNFLDIFNMTEKQFENNWIKYIKKNYI